MKGKIMNQVKEELRTLLSEEKNDEACKILLDCISSELSLMKNDSEYCILAASSFLRAGNLDTAFDFVTMGLINDYRNYELYLLLGEYFLPTNMKQALLCYKQALFYCDKEGDSAIIQSYIDNLLGQGVSIPKVTFIIQKCDNKNIISSCINSIRDTVPPDEYENILVEDELNHVLSDAKDDTDILFLDSRVIFFDNSFFYLMLALHSDLNVGAVGSLTNKSGLFIAEQGVEISNTDKEQIYSIAKELNSPMKRAYERKVFLSKGTMLLRRTALNEVGAFDGKLDDGAEDIDLCVRLNLSGYKVILAYNSFVFNSGDEDREYTSGIDNNNREYLKRKWGCVKAQRKTPVQASKDRGGEKYCFNTLVVITPNDFKRLMTLYPRLATNIGYGSTLFVGAQGVNDLLVADKSLSQMAGFINEDTIIPFGEVHSYMTKKMEPILAGRELPRGVTGWYYQQFLKMQYAFICQDEYYMVWDGDTIPCRKVKMFQEETGKPYLDMKHEFHQEYFDTMSVILPGFRKVIERSFISEHMIIRPDIMRELVREIEKNNAIPGIRFWEKIINAIPMEKIQDSSFSEFETYGTYVALKHHNSYMLREWHSFRLGGSFYDINGISDRDFAWLSKDFDAISFEKGHTVREDNANLFDNPYYQEKLSPKQMLQAAQAEFKEGYIEVWGDEPEANNANISSGSFTSAADVFETGDRLQYLDKETYRIYEKLADSLVERNADQAFLCYENAEYLCDDETERSRIFIKKMNLIDSGKVFVRKTAFVILSYNNKYLMQRCIESIYTNCNPDSYTLFVFDNGSKDGVAEWLSGFGEEHDEVYVILNEDNIGFSGGCNEALKYVPEGYDIFFLNNDVRMPANALFWLRMGLYSDESVGGVGAVQNYMPVLCSEKVNFGVIEQYMKYGASINVPMDNPYEEQCMLCGFAMLIRRDVYDSTQGFDERFNPGYLEDDDISLQIRELGYKLLLVHNAFIYHAGSQSFRERDDLERLFGEHRKIIVEKWKFDSRIAGSISEKEMEFIDSLADMGYTEETRFSVLHIGCGCGAMLGHIHYLYPNAQVVGVEDDDNARKFAISCVPVYKSIDVLPVKTEEYDIVAENLG